MPVNNNEEVFNFLEESNVAVQKLRDLSSVSDLLIL
jgi:hypothetical protein